MILVEFSQEEMSEFFGYIDRLMESGKTNMFGAASYIACEFSLPAVNAQAVMSLWKGQQKVKKIMKD